MSPETDFEADAQDRAEVLDETNLTDDGAELANFDDIDDVYDVTAADGDEDEEDEFDEDEEVDDDDLEAERDDEGMDIEREPLAASADEEDDMDLNDVNDVPTSGAPSRFESATLSDEQIETLGYDDDQPEENDPHVERQLDKGLKETFPASDPVSINPGAD
jgi:hypothetical protein